MAKKKGLGRGLGALIPTEAPDETNESGLRTVKISAITPNPKQPRSTFNEEKLENT